MSEDQIGTIGNLPAVLVEEFHLVHRSGEGHIGINMQSGIANVNGAILEPLMPEFKDRPKVPLFFRRRAMTNATTNPEVSTVFRAIGYSIFEGGRAIHISALRVFDVAIDRAWFSTWPEDTERHVANTGMLIGG